MSEDKITIKTLLEKCQATYSDVFEEILKEFTEKVPDFVYADAGAVIVDLVSQREYDARQMMLYVLNQLSLPNCDEYGLTNIACPLWGINRNGGTKSVVEMTITLPKATTLYKEIPENIPNEVICQVRDTTINRYTYTIQKTQEFEAGTHKVLFECDVYGAIESPIGSITEIVNPTQAFGSEGSSCVNEEDSLVYKGTPPETMEGCKNRIEKTSPVYNPKNLYDAIVKKLTNDNICKNAVYYISKPSNDVASYGVPLGYTYIVCQGGDREKIFEVLEETAFALNLWGNEEKTIYKNNFPYPLNFDYVRYDNLSVKVYINTTKSITADFLNEFKKYIRTKYNERYNNLIFVPTTVGDITKPAEQFIDDWGLNDAYIENCFIALKGDVVNKKKLNPTTLNGCFNIEDTNDIDVVVNNT